MTKKRTVAIVGFAHTTLQFAKDSQADEMWTVNFAWRYGVPRIDRLFEIHPIELLAFNASQGSPDNYDKQHFEWLQEDHDFILYTHADYTEETVLDDLVEVLKESEITGEGYDKWVAKHKNLIDNPPRFPSSVPYPFEILDDIFENFNRENRPGQIYMPSTISYMLALAIHEGFDRIEMYGVEMAAGAGGANGTEYVYQKAGTEALLMYAMGKGIEVYLPEHCKLMNIKPYHKGLQMITRQTLEGLKKSYEQKRVDAISQTNFFKGQIEAAEKKVLIELAALKKEIDAEKVITKKNALEKKYKQREKECQTGVLDLVKNTSHQQGIAFMADGNVQLCSQLIDSIDLDNPLVELVNRFSYKDAEPKEKLEKEKVLA